MIKLPPTALTDLGASIQARLQNLQQKIKQSKLLPILLINIGLVLVLFFIFTKTSNLISGYHQQQLVKNLLSTHQNRPPRPTHIYIPWKVDIAIKQHMFANNQWTIDPKYASHLFTSARPGEPGNIIIYGHNKREILGNIRALEPGHVITITTDDGQKHLYQVDNTYQVKANDTQYLNPTQTETLTLYTCDGFGDQQRFIVRAVPEP